MRDKTKVVLVVLVLILTVSGSIAAINGREEVAAQYRLHTSSSFRYAIVRSEVSKALPARQVWVLMEERAFTEENLKSLYQFVVKRFPEPYQMDIWVYTSLQDVPTPEEADSDEGMSEVKDAPPLSGAPTAVCVRNEKTEYINYFFPRSEGPRTWKNHHSRPRKTKMKSSNTYMPG